MYVVTGCPRSGTSLMMGIMRRALGKGRVLGKRFKFDPSGDIEDVRHVYEYIDEKLGKAESRAAIRALNPGGFWEGKLTSVGLHVPVGADAGELRGREKDVEQEKSTYKVMVDALAKSNPKYVDKVIFMLRRPADALKSRTKLAEVCKAESPERPGRSQPKRPLKAEHLLGTYVRGQGLAADWIVRHGIPTLVVEYDNLVEATTFVLGKIQEFIGEGDFVGAASEVKTGLRHYQSPNAVRTQADDVYDSLLTGDFATAAEASGVQAVAAPREARERLHCVRLGAVVNTEDCPECLAGTEATAALRRRAERQGIDWQAEPCIFECLGRSEGRGQVSLVDSATNNHWQDQKQD